jgi:hypothetical protein
MRKLILVLRNNKIPKLMTGLNTCMVDNRARRHRQRKTSFEYTARKKRILLQRVQRKPADAERCLERRYLTLAQKLIETKQPG